MRIFSLSRRSGLPLRLLPLKPPPGLQKPVPGPPGPPRGLVISPPGTIISHLKVALCLAAYYGYRKRSGLRDWVVSKAIPQRKNWKINRLTQNAVETVYITFCVKTGNSTLFLIFGLWVKDLAITALKFRFCLRVGCSALESKI
mgnify:CR=1 FL=1